MEVKKLAYEEDEEYFDDGIPMAWISPKEFAEIKEEYKKNPPPQEVLDKIQALWNKLMEEQEQERLRRKKSGK